MLFNLQIRATHAQILPLHDRSVATVVEFQTWGNIFWLVVFTVANLGWQLLWMALIPSAKPHDRWSLEFLGLALKLNLTHVLHYWARCRSSRMTRSHNYSQIS